MERVREIAAAQPKVWMEVSVGGTPVGVWTFVLRADVGPRTAENFRGLCTRDYESRRRPGTRLGFEGTRVHRVLPSYGVFCGDIDGKDGRGGESVFGGELPDENFGLRHTGRGVVSMATRGGLDSATTSFMVQLRRGAVPELDGRQVVVGYLLSGWDVLDAVERLATPDGFPAKEITISRCGQVLGDGTAQAGHVVFRPEREKERQTLLQSRERKEAELVVADHVVDDFDDTDDWDQDRAPSRGAAAAPAPPQAPARDAPLAFGSGVHVDPSEAGRALLSSRGPPPTPPERAMRASVERAFAYPLGDGSAAGGQRDATLAHATLFDLARRVHLRTRGPKVDAVRSQLLRDKLRKAVGGPPTDDN
jgi:cyclophilin family peptidyl-prolyl cis-trans isomerase